jgi:TonB family protein
MREAAGPQRMAAVSASATLHAALLAVLMLAPGSWLAERVQEPPVVMTISLGGGTPGPQSGGMTAIGGRAIQTETPPEAARRPEAIRPPAAKTPEMTLPKPGAKPSRSAPAPEVKQAPEDARGRTPTRGDETSAGSTVAETGVRGQGFGLSTGGGAGSGSRLDVADFCCPEYIALMLQRIYGNWNARVEVPGQSMVKFTIQRDGRITDVSVEKPSGYVALDMNAQRALLLTRQLPALPAAFTNPSLTVHLNFEYTR